MRLTPNLALALTPYPPGPNGTPPRVPGPSSRERGLFPRTIDPRGPVPGSVRRSSPQTATQRVPGPAHWERGFWTV